MAVVNIPDPCSKVVVDFREKTNEEIISAIRSKGSQGLCGYFTKSQASRGGKLTFVMARFAAALLLVFGSVLFVTSASGCGGGLAEPDIMDSISHAQHDSAQKAQLIQGKLDSISSTKSTASDTVQWTADSIHAADSIAHEIDPLHYPE
jgi:hypothetical protein